MACKKSCKGCKCKRDGYWGNSSVGKKGYFGNSTMMSPTRSKEGYFGNSTVGKRPAQGYNQK